MPAKNITHPEWDYIERDLAEAVEALRPLTAALRRIIAHKTASALEIKIMHDLAKAVGDLPRLTAACCRIIAHKTASAQEIQNATAAMCEMCRSICGTVIDAEHFIREAIDFAAILPAVRTAHAAVVAAAATLSGPAAGLVRSYGRNIAMRAAILGKFADGDKEGAIDLADAYTEQLIREAALD